ncbi:MAG: hypothetical protein JXR97_06640 [Planctomycetes bacterium]|nr:hypothetical protein [Planctomycetota bacterium]
MKKSSPFIYGCGGCLLLVIAFAGFMAHMYFSAKADYGPVLDDYNLLVKAEKYQDAYDSLATQWKSAQTFEQYKLIETTVKSRLGKIRSYPITGVNIQYGVKTTLTASAVFDKGPCTITYTIIEENGVYKIAGIHYSAPALTGATTCPYCGQDAGKLSKFCPNCGKELTGDSEKTTSDQNETKPVAEQE